MKSRKNVAAPWRLFRSTALAAALATTLGSALATNGYFSNGYGVKAKGLGGASVAVVGNGYAGANNPAIAAWEGNNAHIGLELFAPVRQTSNVGGGGATAKSDGNLFYIPELDYNQALSDRLAVGLTLYTNGLGTDYSNNVMGGSGHLGAELVQATLAPTVAYKLSAQHSVGLSPLLVQQQIKVEGLQGFASNSSNSAALTNRGYDTSSGIGVRLGYLGKLTDALSVGASYAPKIAMTKFTQYAGLFAEQGGFDVPENYTLGAALQTTPNVLVALDYQRINYSGVRAIANPSANLLSGAQLGAANGPGFGWADINVWKLGAQWQVSPQLDLRAGVSVGDSPVRSSDVTFNILAPAVITTHYTLGGTYALSPKTELSFSYFYAPSASVTGNNLQSNGVDTLKMEQQALGVQYGWRW